MKVKRTPSAHVGQARKRAAAKRTIDRAVPIGADPKRRDSYLAKGRIGQVQISGYFDPAVRLALKEIEIKTGLKIQHQLAIALNDWLEKNGRKRLAAEKAA